MNKAQEIQEMLEQFFSGREVSITDTMRILGTGMIKGLASDIKLRVSGVSISNGAKKLEPEVAKKLIRSGKAKRMRAMSVGNMTPDSIAARLHIIKYLEKHKSAGRQTIVDACRAKLDVRWPSIFQQMRMSEHIKPNGKVSVKAEWRLTAVGRSTVAPLKEALAA